MSQLSSTEHRTIVVVDVADFTNPDRNVADLSAVHEGLYEVLRTAFAESGIEFDSCAPEDRGDGALVLVPGNVSKSELADRLPDRLLAALRRYNATRVETARFKLRVAVHFGEVRRNPRGWVGHPLNLAFRIVDAPEAKTRLVDTGGEIALVISERFFEEVIAEDPGAAPHEYCRIAVTVKSYKGHARLRLPGTPAPAPIQPPAVTLPADLPPFIKKEIDDADVLDVSSSKELEELYNRLTRIGISTITTHPGGPAPPLSRPHHVNSSEQTAALPPARTRFRRRQRNELPPVWGNIPPRNKNFTGRDELLERLVQRLAGNGTATTLPSALLGMGGIGKTQMAVEYIYRHLQDYDLVWWLDAAHATQIRAGFTELARHLGLPGSAEAHTAVPAVREALSTGTPFRRWLLVFDAAERPDAVHPFFPTNVSGDIVITSRNSDWAGLAHTIELPLFERDESIGLLHKRGPDIDRWEANLLAEKLGDVPLAIAQAAAYRADTGMPARDYMRLFDEAVAKILGTSSPADYEVSVAAAWNVAFDQLRYRNPAAHQLLDVCAYFSPQPISRDLFTGVSRISISPELDEALRDPIKLARAIRDINRYGLAKIDHGQNTMQLHRLVQLVLRHRATSEQARARMRHGAHQLLARLDPNDPESSRNWPRYRELLPHAYAAEVVGCDDGWVRQLVINLMRFLYQCGDYEEAAQLATRAHADFTLQLGPTHPQTLDVSTRLGVYLWSMGRYAEAAELNHRTLEIRHEVSGSESEETLAAQCNIVLDLRARGDFAAGMHLSEQIFQNSTRLFGEDDPETLYAAYQHGISLRLAGHYRKAAVLDEDTLQRRCDALGVDHQRSYSTNGALLLDLREAGEFVRVRVEFEKLTGRYIDRFGPDNPNAIVFAFLLATARRKDGDYAGALQLSTPTFDQFRTSYGDDHLLTITCGLGHSIDLRHSGDLVMARKLGEAIVDRFRRTLGKRHPHTAGATIDLAITLRLMGEVAAARTLDEGALIQLRASVGADHPHSIMASINLASDHAALGDHELAVELDTEALERGTRVLGEDHPTVLVAAGNLGLNLRDAGRLDEATPLLVTIADRYRTKLGAAHPATVAAVRGSCADCDIDLLLM